MGDSRWSLSDIVPLGDVSDGYSYLLEMEDRTIDVRKLPVEKVRKGSVGLGDADYFGL